MKPILYLIIFILVKSPTYSQVFLVSYEKYRLNEIPTRSDLRTKKKLKNYIKSHIIELDTIFQSYNNRMNFHFNTADTLFLIYDSPAESPFTNDIIIWSGKDTISYKQEFEMIKPYKYKRRAVYAPFRTIVENVNGHKLTTERDSVITLVSLRDYKTILHLGDNQNISDGSYINIYVAYKENGQYKIESCSPPKFVIMTTYRKNREHPSAVRPPIP